MRVRPCTRVWTTNARTPEGCALTPKWASAPSQSVYSAALGRAAAMAFWVRGFFTGLRVMTHLLPASTTRHRFADDPGDMPGGVADMRVREMGVAVGRGVVGMTEQGPTV